MEKIEQIQLFLQGRLSGEPLRRFERQLAEDQELQKMVADYDRIFKGFGQLRRARMAEKVGNWKEELPDLPEVKSRPRGIPILLRRIAIVAALIGVVGLAYFSYLPQRELNQFPENSYFPLITSMDRASTTMTDFKQAEAYFDQGAYLDCLEQLEAIRPLDSIYLQALYLREHAYYQSGQYEAALSTYQELKNIKTESRYMTKNFDAENAAWTAVLARLSIYLSTKTDKALLEKELAEFKKLDPEETYLLKAERLADLLR